MWISSLNRVEKYSVSVLSLLVFILRIPLALRPERSLTGLPYTDDSFFLFSIARNLAAGRPPTVDGVHLTNGFQPLIVLFYMPVFWLCGTDGWLAVRWTFIINGVFAALSVWAVALLLRSLERVPQTKGLTAPIAGAAIWMCSIEILGQMTNGLETGLYSLLLLIAIMLYAKLYIDEPHSPEILLSRWGLLGIVLGLCVLARIDAAILVAILVIMLVVKKRIFPAIIVGGTALIVSAPWWIFNMVSFGSLMPSSGQSENSWPMPEGENIRRAGKAISDIIMLIFYIPWYLGNILRAALTLVLIFGIPFVFYRTGLAARIRASFRTAPLIPFLFFSIALLIYYSFFFRAPHFISRYLQPGRILWSVIVAVSASIIWQNKTLWQKKIARCVITGAAILALAFTIEGYAVEYFPALQASDFYEIGQWANRHPDEKIGMFQSGISSFIAPNVINLDGKVNSDALIAHQQGRLGQYLRDENFTYLADWKAIEGIAAIARKDNLYFDSVGMIGNIQLMKRRDR